MIGGRFILYVATGKYFSYNVAAPIVFNERSFMNYLTKQALERDPDSLTYHCRTDDE